MISPVATVSHNLVPDVEIKQTVKDKIWNIVKSFFSGILAAGLLIINPSLFVAAFFIGVIWTDRAKEAIDKVVAVWKKQPWVTSAIIVGCGVLALPAALAATSVLYAVYFGSNMPTS